VAAIVKDLEMTISNRIPVLTPQGHLVLAPTGAGVTLPGSLQERLEAAFERSVGHGLLELGIREVGTALPAEFAYWRDFAGRYVSTLCTSAQPVGATDRAAASTIETPFVLIGGVPGKVFFSGLSPQFVGVNQLNVQVPNGVTPGSAVPLTIKVNGFTTTTQVVVAIE